MINFLREKMKSRKYLLLLKKYTEPSKEFSKKSRSLFISELSERGIMKKAANPSPFSLRKTLDYGFASLSIFVIFAGGIVVYAQKQNVDSNNPVYPMKLLGENIQIKLATPEEKPILQAEFAQRRMAEIKQLISEKQDEINLINYRKTEEAKQTIEKIDKKKLGENQIIIESPEIIQQIEEEKKHAIEQIEEEREQEIEKIENKNRAKTEELNDHFHDTVDFVLKTIEPSEKEHKSRERAKDLCESLRENIKEHAEVMGENDQWPDFEEKCEKSEEDD